MYNMVLKKICIAALACLFFVAPLHIFADDNDSGVIQVTATIPPAASSYSTSIAASPTTTVQQDQEITYTITYGSTYVSAYNLTLQASWSQGTIDGAVTPTVDVAEYVLGSAGTGYGGATPVIDTINRTITWNITAFPAQEEETVSFKLNTTSNYTGENTVTFDVSSQITAPVTTGVDIVVSTYQYVVPPAPTPTPTPSTSTGGSGTSTSTSQSTTTATPTAAPITTTPQIQSVQLVSIGASSAQIQIITVGEARLKLQYGTSISQLNKAVTLLEKGRVHTFVLTDLQPNARYYFQVLNAENNAQLLTDVFTFLTAVSTERMPEIVPTSLVVTQRGSFLYNGGISSSDMKGLPLTVIAGNVIDLYLTIPNSEALQSAEVFIREWRILGAMTERTEELQSTSSLLTKTTFGTSVGKVRVPEKIGEYEVVARLKDIYGNYKEVPIVKLHVISKLIITSESSGEPIEHAKLLLSLYNSNTRLYEVISAATTSIKNPTYSDAEGVVFLNLAPGKYRAEVSSVGFKPQNVEFEITVDGAYQLPSIILKPVINWWLAIKFFQAVSAIFNIVVLIMDQMQLLAVSNNFYVFMLSGTSIIFIVSGMLGAFLKMHPQYNLEKLLTYHRPFITQRIVSFLAYFGIQIILFASEFFLLLASIFSILFILSFGIEKSALFIVTLVGCIILWIIDLTIYIRNKRNNC